MASKPENSEIRFKYTHPATGVTGEMVMGKMSEQKVLVQHMSAKSIGAESELLKQALYRKTITGDPFEPAVVRIDNESADIFPLVYPDLVHEVAAFAPGGFMSEPAEGLFVTEGFISHEAFPKLSDERFVPRRTSVSFSEMASSWTRAESTRLFYDLWGGTMTGKRLILDGWHLRDQMFAYYLTKHNAALTAFRDDKHWYFNPIGWTIEEIEDFIFGKKPPKKFRIKDSDFPEALKNNGAEIFSAGNSVNRNLRVAQALIPQGFEVYVDRPIEDMQNWEKYNSFLEQLDGIVGVIPSFITSSGNVRVLHHVIQERTFEQDIELILDLTGMVEAALAKVHQFNMNPEGIRKKCIEIAEKMSLA